MRKKVLIAARNGKPQQATVEKKWAEEMKKQFNSPEWKKQMEDLKSQSLAMQKQFNSPEWKAQQEQWKKQAEDI